MMNKHSQENENRRTALPPVTSLPVILASASPRRRELLQMMGIDFIVMPATWEERITDTDPAKVVVSLSRQKALEVAMAQTSECLVIGADTVVACDGQILGKPRDEEDAVRMLMKLQGRAHSVFTGVTVFHVQRAEDMQERNGQRKEWQPVMSFAEETIVHMYPSSEEELRAYAETGDPLDKAGSYAIQGPSAVFIRAIEGDYQNVVGLPLARLYQQLKQWERNRVQ